MKACILLILGTAALAGLTACGPKTTATAADSSGAAINTLTPEEKTAGWELLFNGSNLDGWHNFHSISVAPGWQVKDGNLVCADPENAGDIVTTNQYSWFELQLDYNITDGGNSGILYHVIGEEIPTLQSGPFATWYTGPEFQLLDNVHGRDAEPRQMSGWLYGLYQPPNDPKTGLPLDATKPVGQWNDVRLLVTPEKCEHDINGVKYFDYVLGSDDFKARVAKSKFSRIPCFAISDTGYIALQGDHGAISFRNIKIRVITSK